MGIDVDPARLDLARRFGAEELVNAGAGECPIAAASRFSRGRGVDAVLLTLATKSSEPLHQAAQMCRKRGRIVLVGIAGLELSRADFYEKELSFQVSCSYGPGRYDPDYEEKGVDYPVGFVRWTEQRNFEAVLDLMAGGALDLAPLISHRFDFADAPEAYELLASKEESLGILLRYPAASAERRPEHIVDLGSSAEAVSGSSAPSGTKTAGVLVIGAGNYAGRVLIPAFQAAGAQLATLVSAQGVSASHYGRRFGFKRIATDAGAALAENGSEIVVIATRHDSHAEHVIAAMAAHKHVFVEKPLCLTLDELRRIDVAVCEAAKQSSSILMVGFNRRFAPLVQRAHSLLHAVNQPRAVMITVNAGQIPASHWTQDLAVGGGRIVGEACHFIDLARFLVGHPVRDWTVHALNGAPRDSVAISLAYEDGSIATINYLANGHRVVPKERIEVYCAGRVIELDNFRRLRAHGWADFSRQSNWRQDKGQQNCVKAFVEAVRAGRASPIPYHEVLESSRIAIEVQQRLQAK
jgi:predicted dehydrogenase